MSVECYKPYTLKIQNDHDCCCACDKDSTIAHLGQTVYRPFLLHVTSSSSRSAFQGRSIPGFAYLVFYSSIIARVAGWDPYNLHDLLNTAVENIVSWVGSGVRRSCSISPNGRWEELLRGTIVNRTYGIHKSLSGIYIFLYFYYYGGP